MADIVKVKKSNRVLKILPTDLEHYLKLGYDQINDKGEIIRTSDKKTYTAAEYNKLLEENKALKKKISELKKSE